jgi:hypothetical protein
MSAADSLLFPAAAGALLSPAAAPRFAYRPTIFMRQRMRHGGGERTPLPAATVWVHVTAYVFASRQPLYERLIFISRRWNFKGFIHPEVLA